MSIALMLSCTTNDEMLSEVLNVTYSSSAIIVHIMAIKQMKYNQVPRTVMSWLE